MNCQNIAEWLGFTKNNQKNCKAFTCDGSYY